MFHICKKDSNECDNCIQSSVIHMRAIPTTPGEFSLSLPSDARILPHTFTRNHDTILCYLSSISPIIYSVVRKFLIVRAGEIVPSQTNPISIIEEAEPLYLFEIFK